MTTYISAVRIRTADGKTRRAEFRVEPNEESDSLLDVGVHDWEFGDNYSTFTLTPDDAEWLRDQLAAYSTRGTQPIDSRPGVHCTTDCDLRSQDDIVELVVKPVEGYAALPLAIPLAWALMGTRPKAQLRNALTEFVATVRQSA